MNNCPIINECHELNEVHLRYLHSLRTPEAIVWGNANGSRNDHAWCSSTNKMDQTVERVRAIYPAVLSMSFNDFEHLYMWVFEKLMKGIWVSARVLHYDIALRIAANHVDSDKLMPSSFIYLHGKPWRTAKALDEKLKVMEFRMHSSYLDHIFDCGHCNPRIKEHALCHYHKKLVQFAKDVKRDGKQV